VKLAFGADTTAGRIYDSEQLEAVPDSAAAASAGCGNPVALGDLKPGETVVDLGSGGGIDCFLAADAVGPEGSVIGVDMTHAMVKLARENAKKLGTDNVVFKLAPIEAIPMPDATADVVISNCVIALAPDKDAVFSEAFRVLKSGGRLFVSDMVTVGALPENVVSDPEQWVACVAGADDRDVYLQRISSSGFSKIQLIEESRVPTSSREPWRDAVRSVTVKAVKPAG
jgi:ubiquinone/menaquinone biosynthesis C-methylase UbiE